MSEPLTAQDLWPLVLKLPHDERIRLARLALKAAAASLERVLVEPLAEDYAALVDRARQRILEG